MSSIVEICNETMLHVVIFYRYACYSFNQIAKIMKESEQ